MLFLAGITLLFVDFTGTAHAWLGWMAKIQFLPALLAVNVIVVVGLVALTLLFGRVYCSVICPLGIMQDIFGRLGLKARRYRYSWSPARNILRYIMLTLMVIALLAGASWFFTLFAPYSAYGRIAQSFFAPIWAYGNNILAYFAERADSYAFYTTDVWIRSWVTFTVAALTLIVLAVLAWRNGRTYCNTICPVGTVLGFLSKYSYFRPVIDKEKCNRCGLCARSCKGACINPKEHTIDYSRCVACMDCLEVCRHGAISYTRRRVASPKDTTEQSVPDKSRRVFFTGLAVAAGAAVTKAQDKVVDGGLATIEDKKKPARATKIVPPGARGLAHLSNHCTACQLCVAACPNGVLRPSTELGSFMQPEASYEIGYCRPECTRCSEVCPAGAILPITREEKTAIQVGHAVWRKENCVVITDGVHCGHCAAKCPTGAITMVPLNTSKRRGRRIPVVNVERCIGCGACENLCPARPFSAIYVEGHENHRNI